MKVMNKIYLIMVLPLLALSSCSFDEVLKPEGGLNVSIAMTETPIKATIGDTITINVLASTNGGEVTRIELVKVGATIEELRDEIKFGLTAADKPLTIDGDGYLSRGISSVVMIHKFIVTKDDKLFGKEFNIDYRIYTKDGEIKSVSAPVKVMNYINNSTMARVPLAEAKEGRFFDPIDNVLYTKENYKANKEKIEIIVYADSKDKYYCLNPAAMSTETIMRSIGFDDYSAAEMRNTKFVKSPKIFNYYSLDAEQLKNLVFDTAIDDPNLATDNICSFLTQDGKKGCMRIKVASKVFMISSKMEAVIR